MFTTEYTTKVYDARLPSRRTPLRHDTASTGTTRDTYGARKKRERLLAPFNRHSVRGAWVERQRRKTVRAASPGPSNLVPSSTPFQQGTPYLTDLFQFSPANIRPSSRRVQRQNITQETASSAVEFLHLAFHHLFRHRLTHLFSCRCSSLFIFSRLTSPLPGPDLNEP
ncbi:hypothetical protein BJ508DRAFT_119503 [Ascobolus immersus RN42]|uniref:Uncharacterized protein n=1 Tax=Ascobolus immersus RN42 TaxID=1160509 RepID=A0A3N4ILH1_ASCIM|nr:hypothetical protein BJ508DRAFT_119503 [Ascobolus immersus RN42]